VLRNELFRHENICIGNVFLGYRLRGLVLMRLLQVLTGKRTQQFGFPMRTAADGTDVTADRGTGTPRPPLATDLA
jgi:hypothetical protein